MVWSEDNHGCAGPASTSRVGCGAKKCVRAMGDEWRRLLDVHLEIEIIAELRDAPQAEDAPNVTYSSPSDHHRRRKHAGLPGCVVLSLDGAQAKFIPVEGTDDESYGWCVLEGKLMIVILICREYLHRRDCRFARNVCCDIGL